jgi:hypothetical protein
VFPPEADIKAGLTVIVNALEVALPALSVAVIVKEEVVDDETEPKVPVNEPLLVFKLIPPGSEPEVNEYVIVAPASGSVADTDSELVVPEFTVPKEPAAVLQTGAPPVDNPSFSVAIPLLCVNLTSRGPFETVKS